MHRRHPIRFLASAALAACLLAPGVQAVEEPPAAGPVASFPAPLHDFGEVERGDTLEHSFVVRNEGDAPLQILSAKPT